MHRFMRNPFMVQVASASLGVCGLLLSLGLPPGVAQAEAAQWPQWRGPTFDGASPETDLPKTFSKTESVRWNVALPGASAATPAVWDDRVYLPSVDDQAGTLVALCLDLANGNEVWRRTLATGTRRDDRSNYASPSPITDGRHVWFYTSTGELVAFDLKGTETWRRNIQRDYGEFAFLWTYSSSPLLFDGRLYVQVLQRNVPVSGRGRSDGPNDSYLLALDPHTGKELWRQIRPSDAVAEAREAFSTPVPLLGTSRREILLLGGDCVTGHHPETGEELWRWGTYNPRRIGHYRLVPSPVAGDGVILACGPKGEPVYAVKAGLEGVLSDDDLAWVSQDRAVTSDVPTPLYYQGRFYILDGNRKALSCVEPKTGRVIWTGSLECRAPFEASPTGADGRVFCVNHRGEVFVVAAGDEFKVLHQVDMGDEHDRNIRSSVVAAQKRLLLRTNSRLYCFGN
jgi:outer membrane protein assembly factor BamB